MRKTFSVLLLLLPLMVFAAPPMMENFSKATQLAQLYNRPMILVFTGSDWCDWSQKVSKELFETEEFSEAIGNSFIFVQLDFPKTTDKAVIISEQNLRLKEQYHVDQFPSLVMIEPDGREITRISYSEKTAEQFAYTLKGIFSKFLLLQNEVAKVDLASLEESKLEELYNEAMELKCPTFISQLLDQGLKSGTSAFFPVEKYSQLVLEGKVDQEEAVKLKQVIRERDEDNEEGARLRLALLDFQSHIDDPDRATEEPLSYIRDFGKKEDDNLWRLHMLISDYFSEHGREEEAKEHAEKTLETAPESIKAVLSGENE